MELLLIALVAVIVFGPDKLPMLARHLGKLFRQINIGKQHLDKFWQNEVQQQQLRVNQQKAEKADSEYQKPEKD